MNGGQKYICKDQNIWSGIIHEFLMLKCSVEGWTKHQDRLCILREDEVTYTPLGLLMVVHLPLDKASIPNRGCALEHWAKKSL